MQTVTFQCGRCGKLIAVEVEYLGRQVRCPHCQSVVLTRSPAAEPAPPVLPDSPSLLSSLPPPPELPAVSSSESPEYPVLPAAVPEEAVGRESDPGAAGLEPAAPPLTAPETGSFSPAAPEREAP